MCKTKVKSAYDHFMKKVNYFLLLNKWKGCSNFCNLLPYVNPKNVSLIPKSAEALLVLISTHCAEVYTFLCDFVNMLQFMNVVFTSRGN